MSDAFPEADNEFNTVANSFGTWLDTHFASVGLSAGENTVIQDAVTDWNAKQAAHLAAQAAARLASVLKDTSRSTLEAALRPVARKVTNPTTRTEAGLNEYADRRARVPVPTTRPLLMVDTSQRFQHLIKFKDETGPGRGRPDGVRHIEIWCSIGPTPPADPTACSFVSTDTNSPYLNNVDPAHAGSLVHYIGRWVNTRGEHGPWSETVSATVAG